ncbi:hypothetical protein [Aeribacillus pallidus]
MVEETENGIKSREMKTRCKRTVYTFKDFYNEKIGLMDRFFL